MALGHRPSLPRYAFPVDLGWLDFRETALYKEDTGRTGDGYVDTATSV